MLPWVSLVFVKELNNLLAADTAGRCLCKLAEEVLCFTQTTEIIETWAVTWSISSLFECSPWFSPLTHLIILFFPLPVCWFLCIYWCNAVNRPYFLFQQYRNVAPFAACLDTPYSDLLAKSWTPVTALYPVVLRTWGGVSVRSEAWLRSFCLNGWWFQCS